MSKRVKQKICKKKRSYWYIFFLIIIIWGGSSTIKVECISRQIDRDPVEVYAYVFSEYVICSRKGGHEYHYRFKVNGVMYYGYAYKNCDVGDRILIRYLRTDPSKNKSVNNGVIIRPE